MADLSVFKKLADTNPTEPVNAKAKTHKEPIRMPAPGEEWTSHPTNMTPGAKPIDYNSGFPSPD